MSVYVSWGNESSIYQKSNENYNSTEFRWLRYSENLKRGWVLNCESGKVKTTILGMGSGLLKLEKFRNIIGRNYIKPLRRKLFLLDECFRITS
jgi:hypothetical protein